MPTHPTKAKRMAAYDLSGVDVAGIRTQKASAILARHLSQKRNIPVFQLCHRLSLRRLRTDQILYDIIRSAIGFREGPHGCMRNAGSYTCLVELLQGASRKHRTTIPFVSSPSSHPWVRKNSEKKCFASAEGGAESSDTI
jgi:hypothetical protein